MPSTRGAGRDEQSTDLRKKRLGFRDKLVGKGLATDALLKKLKTLHSELEALEQDGVHTPSLESVRKELLHSTLLLHKDRGVKAYVACCHADLLRLYAPECQYTEPELQDVFDFMFRQLGVGLTAQDAPYYAQYYHLLDSLSGVKSVVLICDLPGSEKLMRGVFKEFFAIVKRDLPKKIELFCADILAALIEESKSIPSDILEKYLLSQFKGDHARMDRPAFRLAVSVCRATADILQRHVCQFFTDVLVEHSDPDTFAADEVESAHEIIKHLHRACPALLHNVIPQLEEEMRADDYRLRMAAVTVLAEMFGEEGPGGRECVRRYSVTWEYWMGRRNDKDAHVRVAWVESARGIVLHNEVARVVVEQGLRDKLLEPDEKVRAAACKLYASLDYETALHHVSEAQLKEISARVLDKKASVRDQAAKCLGTLYNLAYSDIESDDPAALAQLAWIPDALLAAYSAVQARLTVEAVVAEHILPLPVLSKEQAQVDEVAWTDRLLTVMKHLSSKGHNVLFVMSGLKASRPTVYDKFVQACIDNNGGVIDENEEQIQATLDALMTKIAAPFPDPPRIIDDLTAFAKLNSDRLYKLLKTCLDPQTDLKSLLKARSDFRKRLESSSAALLPTFDALLRRGTLWVVNTSSIPPLVRRLRSPTGNANGNGSAGEEGSEEHAKALLVFVSKHCPAIYKPHLSELIKAFSDSGGKNSTLVEVTLQALAGVVQWDPELFPSDSRVKPRLLRFVASANHRHAKFAARILACAKKEDELPEQAVDTIVENLPSAEPEFVTAHLSALAQFASKAPDAFEARSEDIIAFVVRDVLGKPAVADSDETDDSPWVPNEALWPELRARIVAIKLCRNRCLAHAGTEGAMLVATPVLRMLTTILAHRGSLTAQAEVDDDPKVQTRMRLQAGISLLRLAGVKEYAEMITQTGTFVDLALVAQDEQHEVRKQFVKTLLMLLVARTLSPKFNVVVFIVAHDPEPEIPNMVRGYVKSMFSAMSSQMRIEEFEIPFIRVLHLLSHHPDMANIAVDPATVERGEDDELDPAEARKQTIGHLAKYIQFYVDLVSTADNIHLLYHVAMKAKTVRDIEGPAASDRLYTTSELAQHILKQHAHRKGWTLETYPAKVKIPGDIFKPAHNVEEQQGIIRKVFLPEETLAEFAEQVKADAKEKQKMERKAKAAKAGTKRKAPASKANGSSKRTRRKKRQDSDDEEEEQSSEEEMEVDSDRAAARDEDEDEDEEDPTLPPPVTSSPREERLSRGARTRANAKIREQTKPRPKPRPRGRAKKKLSSSDNDDDEEEEEDDDE